MALSKTGVRGAILLAALAVLVADPGASLARDGALSRRALEGQLVILHADDFARGQSANSHAVLTADGSFVEVDVSRLRGVDRLVGKHVVFDGSETSSGFVATGDVGVQSAATTTSAATARRTAVILFNFTNNTEQPWTTGAVSNVVFGASASVASYYQEVSYGSTTFDGAVLGWLTIPYDNSGCLYSNWSVAALAASHVDPAQYAHVVYAFPYTTNCRWAGLSTIGGKFSWINGAMTVRTVGHELAHSMGVHHASALNCTSNGIRVTLSSTCTRSEYGDPFSIMGTGTRHLNNWERSQTGWLPETQTITSSGHYSISPAELTTQPRLFRLPRGDGNYLYFEFRKPFGAYDNFDSSAPVVNGVTIRVAPDKQSRVQSLLLDMRPSTPGFDDAPLTLGKSFTDPASGVTITTTAVSSTGATISVQWPGASLPAPSPSPTPSPTPSSTPTPSPTPSPTSTPSPSPTDTPSSSPTTSPSPSPSASPSPTASPPTSANDALTAPTKLKAVRLERRKVKITWGASLGAVAGYKVFRNGVRLGRTTSLRFYDWVPADVVRARYVVRAFDRWGRLGPRSAYFTLRMP
jgi:Gametolysin peptidase M11